MDHTPPNREAAGPIDHRRNRLSRHVHAIALMLICFGLVVWQRDRIRAHWWVSRIGQTEDSTEQIFFAARMAGLGDIALGAVNRLARDARPEISTLAVLASSGFSEHRRADFLKQLLYSSDDDLRHEAARALAFMDSPTSRSHLLLTSIAADRNASVAALSGLARLEGADVVSAICLGLQHEEPFVRAQAVESLSEQIRSSPDLAQATPDASDCDPIAALVGALGDDSEFIGQLALEREIAAVSSALQVQHGLSAELMQPSERAGKPERQSRTVAAVAAAVLSDLTGHTLQPQSEMGAPRREGLIEDCRRWIGERSISPDVPPDLPTPSFDRQ